MNNNPLVSFLIPNYNKASYLRETLRSVLAQTYTHWECIIVDDHSTDNSWRILEEYVAKDSRFRIYKRPESRLPGGNAARNFAFEMSHGEYINWLDSDDLLQSSSLFEKLNVLSNDNQLDFVFGNISQFESDVSQSKEVVGLDLSQTNINYSINFLKGNFWVGSMLPLFKRSFLEKFNTLFNESLKRDQETEFFIRVFLKHPSFKYVETSIAYWRKSENSKTIKFRSLPLGERQINSYHSFKVIFANFKKGREISVDERNYFKWYFGVQLATMKVNFRDYIDLILFGLRNGTFPNLIFVPKILIYRFLTSIGIDLQNFQSKK